MIKLSCLCGRLRVQTERPAFINECNCTLCCKTGARWAYFHPASVAVEGESFGFSRHDKPEPAAEIRFCPRCGATTHFVLTAQAAAKFGNTMMGVNMWLAEPADLVGIELRFPDGRTWSGAGEFGHVRPSRIIGDPSGVV